MNQAKESYYLDAGAWSRGWRLLLAGAAAGWAASLYGWATDAYDFHGSYLVNYLFFLSLAWGALFFVMIQHVTTAAWSVALRRLMENAMATMPAMTLLFLPVALGLNTLYEWAKPGFLNAHDPNMRFKAIFFSQPFYLIRSGIYLAVWSVLAIALYRNSVAQDAGGSVDGAARARRWSAPGLLALTATVTMAGVDWVMSLDPHWYSTIFGVYVFSGGALAFLAALTLAALGLQRLGMLRRAITVEHYHDLGKWMFGLTVWWAYIGFSQYMLIWYANLPEETTFYHARFASYWSWVSAGLLLGHFVVPFVLLMPRAAKRSRKVLGLAAAWLLIMHGMDLHWLVMPSVHPHAFHIQWLDVATFVAVGSSFGLAFWHRLRRNALAPVGDARLAESLAHHNA
ncbi:MAG: hypothetical protein KIT09_19885 [Bryobacteraceae bacterium]|nr:hypothetical protein [Bryobacteraceae bacterium]